MKVTGTRSRLALVAAAAALTWACSDTPTPTDLDRYVPSLGKGGGKGGGGKGGGGGDTPVVEDFDFWDPVLWEAGDHPLGKGWLRPENVAHSPGTLLLTLPAGRYDGGEIRSEVREGYGAYEARLRTPTAPGSISAFFLYEYASRRNDEIDIEIFNDGSRRIWFTTWVRDRQTNHDEQILWFDPSAGFHDYLIEWASGRVRFFVDGVLLREWTSGVPKDAMHVMVNTWWPSWLSGPTLADARSLEIDRIVY